MSKGRLIDRFRQGRSTLHEQVGGFAGWNSDNLVVVMVLQGVLLRERNFRFVWKVIRGSIKVGDTSSRIGGLDGQA